MRRLVAIARFADLWSADSFAAFLRSRGVDAHVEGADPLSDQRDSGCAGGAVGVRADPLGSARERTAGGLGILMLAAALIAR